MPLANISRWQGGDADGASRSDRKGEEGGSGTSVALNVSGGALFMTTVGFRPGKGSRGMDWDGGCWWALTDGASALEPGKAMLVGTGIEDFFNSGFAFGFFGKTFHNDLSGLSHVHGSTGHGLVNPRPDWFSAYRYFVRPSSRPRPAPPPALLSPTFSAPSLSNLPCLPLVLCRRRSGATCSHVACGTGSGPADVL